MHDELLVADKAHEQRPEERSSGKSGCRNRLVTEGNELGQVWNLQAGWDFLLDRDEDDAKKRRSATRRAA